MKVAIVHDWLVTYAGAERVLEQMLNVYPDADIFSIVDFIEDGKRDFILNKKVTTSFVQKLPFSKKKYRSYLPIMTIAIEQFDLSKYDVIISSSHAVAKGVITGPDQLHICMCYSPIRYAWDLQNQYLVESGLDKGIKGLIARLILHKIRIWDVRTSLGVDKFIAISKYISRRIEKVYRRDSDVIYPPVYIDKFLSKNSVKEEYYFTASRMVPYKKIDLIVEVFTNKFPDKKLYVIGDGPDYNKIRKIAGKNVTLLGYRSTDELIDYMRSAKAFIFAAEEDFGIAPLEAQACGVPVIAFGKGGALETIRDNNHEQPTGIFFGEQTIDSLADAIVEFEKNPEIFLSENCVENARRFNESRFRTEFKNYIESEYLKWKTSLL